MSVFNYSSAELTIAEVDYIRVWDVERSLDLPAWKLWFEEMHRIIPGNVFLLYIGLCFWGENQMKNRKPFSLRTQLAIWNFMLAAFSILTFVRTIPELNYILRRKDAGFYSSVCRLEHHNQATAFWVFLMTLSKAVELGDTVFLVLMKKPLTFLNWGHHACAFFASWQMYSVVGTSGRWFAVMNAYVHTIMYTYFGLKSLNFQVPKFVSIIVTLSQLLQMVIGTYIGFYTLYMKHSGVECTVPLLHSYIAFFGYAIFAYLFGSYFYGAYLAPQRTSKKPVKQE